MFHRMRSDFRLSIITLLGACAILGITPFAIWRFMRGDTLIGVVDVLILAGILSMVIYTWRTGDTLRAGFVLALVICGGGIAIATLAGEAGLFWLYPALICTFFLTLAWVAVCANLTAVLFLILHGGAFSSAEQMLSFVVTAIVVSTCAYVFALRNEKQHQRLEQLATRDPLTGVKNRRAMDEELNSAVAAFARNQVPCGLVLLDLDYFKEVNDTYGHSIGDDILVLLVSLLESTIRRTDQLFRYGGEEFVLLLPGLHHGNFHTVMKNIQKALHKSLKSPAGPVTASFGVALLDATDDATSWMSRADHALYKAKANGRDQVVLADAPCHSPAVAS